MTALVLSTLASGCGGGDDVRASRPDVFVVVVDTLRADRLSSYGFERPTSPRLDELARQGVRFDDVTAQSSWTKPSMVSLWTGQYMTGYQDTMAGEQPCLAETLQRVGYHTIGVVGNVLLSKIEGFDRGFDHYDARRLTKEEQLARRAAGGSIGPCRDANELVSEYLASIDSWLEAQAGSPKRPPLFAYLHPMEPHAPYLLHESLSQSLRSDAKVHDLSQRWQRAAWDALAIEAPESDPDWDGAWQSMGRARLLYEREILYLDQILGGLIDRLEERGLLENAIVVLASDHGEGLYDHVDFQNSGEPATTPQDHFQMEHGRNLYQELVGTPLVIWGRGVSSGLVVDEPVENLDLFPTLLELCDVALPAGLHGRSLAPALRGDAFESKPSVHSFEMPHVMIRDVKTDLKLVVPTKFGSERGAKPRLFDLSTDPGELVDLFEERQDEASALLERIQEWRRTYPTYATGNKLKDATTLEDLKALGYLGD